MQVKHLLLLVVLILMIPPGFYYLMNSTSQPEKETPFNYEVVQTGNDSISVKISESDEPASAPYYDQYVQKLKSTPTWLVQDANFQGCVTKAVDNCVANTTQKEAQLLQSDTLCDALPAGEAASCKNQFHYTKAIKEKDISLCEQITNEFQRNACQNGVFTQKALETRDPRWCDKVAASNNTPGLISPEKQNCLNLLDLQGGPSASTFIESDFSDSTIQETVLD
jgi:hypothetical protein